jgi:hypothetical protein
MGLAFALIAFLGFLAAAFRPLGWHSVALLAVGSASGVVRANYMGLYTTFMLDRAVLALYSGLIIKQPGRGQLSDNALLVTRQP